MEGFWEAKIHDFRTFFDVFSKSFLKCVSEGEKIDQKFEKNKLFRFLASGLRCTGRAWGEIIERGNTKISETLVDRPFDVGVLVFDVGVVDIDLARRAPPSVGGGLKTPWVGHRRPPTLGSRR